MGVDHGGAGRLHGSQAGALSAGPQVRSGECLVCPLVKPLPNANTNDYSTINFILAFLVATYRPLALVSPPKFVLALILACMDYRGMSRWLP